MGDPFVSYFSDMTMFVPYTCCIFVVMNHQELQNEIKTLEAKLDLIQQHLNKMWLDESTMGAWLDELEKELTQSRRVVISVSPCTKNKPTDVFNTNENFI